LHARPARPDYIGTGGSGPGVRLSSRLKQLCRGLYLGNGCLVGQSGSGPGQWRWFHYCKHWPNLWADMTSDNRACELIYSQSNRLGTGRGSNPACYNLAYRLGHFTRPACPESMGWFSLPSFPGRLHVHNIRVGQTRREHGYRR
jgi:hypothetical protein